jgi:MscS family membrane protein
VLSLLFRTYHQNITRQDAGGLLLRGRRVALAWTRVLLIGLIPPLASLDPSVDEGLILTCHAQVEASDWPRYLEARQRFILRLRQILSQGSQCYVHFGVSFDTSSETLRAIPQIVAQVFRAEPLARLRGCRVLRISDFSLDCSVEYASDQPTLALFEAAHSRRLCALIETLRARGIAIPIPTTVEIEKVMLAAASAPSP